MEPIKIKEDQGDISIRFNVLSLKESSLKKIFLNKTLVEAIDEI